MRTQPPHASTCGPLPLPSHLHHRVRRHHATSMLPTPTPTPTPTPAPTPHAHAHRVLYERGQQRPQQHAHVAAAGAAPAQRGVGLAVAVQVGAVQPPAHVQQLAPGGGRPCQVEPRREDVTTPGGCGRGVRGRCGVRVRVPGMTNWMMEGSRGWGQGWGWGWGSAPCCVAVACGSGRRGTEGGRAARWGTRLPYTQHSFYHTASYAGSFTRTAAHLQGHGQAYDARPLPPPSLPPSPRPLPTFPTPSPPPSPSPPSLHTPTHQYSSGMKPLTTTPVRLPR